MDNNSFRKWAARAAEWGVDYRQSIRDFPVRSQSKPGDLIKQLPSQAPESPEPFEKIFADFERIVVPGITHWQHPRFFAYFPSNSAPPSVLAEYLTAALASQCMIWQTSPAATELETVMLRWFADAVGLPEEFSGVIQDTASTATLAAILTMRERGLDWKGNREGLAGHPRLRVYASNLVHSSIDRAIWISGIGENNLVRIPTAGPNQAMVPSLLEAAIKNDLKDGFVPIGIVACIGGTSFGACDDIEAVCRISQKYKLYTHVDAAWAGVAMICPEFRTIWKGIEGADSIVVNPHKWLGAQFDCCTHFVKSPELLLKTLAIHPEYLKTFDRNGLTDYCEWTVQLGRRFRALKLWFVLRYYGLENLRARIRRHVNWSRNLAMKLSEIAEFEIVTPPVLSLFTFRLAPKGFQSSLDDLNLRFINHVNDDGRIYLSSTRVDDKLVLRFQVGQFETEDVDLETASRALIEMAFQVLATNPDRTDST